MRISTAEKEIFGVEHEIKKKQNIFHIIDQIKVSRVPLWIRHCHLCMEGHFKIRLQSLQRCRTTRFLFFQIEFLYKEKTINKHIYNLKHAVINNKQQKNVVFFFFFSYENAENFNIKNLVGNWFFKLLKSMFCELFLVFPGSLG